MYIVKTARSVIIQSGIQSVFSDQRPFNCYAKENNEKSLVLPLEFKAY